MKNAWMMLVIAGLIAFPVQSFAQDAQKAPAANAAAEKIATVADTANTAADVNKEDLKAEVDALQEDILANQDLMKEIEELLKDEEIVKLLSNPELVAAITSYDPTKIEGNTSVQELMKNPKVNALIEKIGKLYESQNAGGDATAPAATQ